MYWVKVFYREFYEIILPLRQNDRCGNGNYLIIGKKKRINIIQKNICTILNNLLQRQLGNCWVQVFFVLFFINCREGWTMHIIPNLVSTSSMWLVVLIKFGRVILLLLVVITFPLVIPIIKWNCSKNKEILVYTEIKSRARKTLTWRHHGFICWHAASTCKMCSCMMRHS